MTLNLPDDLHSPEYDRGFEDGVKLNLTAKANLGLARTEDLLVEILVRIDQDYPKGGGGLNFTTFGGRPIPPEETQSETPKKEKKRMASSKKYKSGGVTLRGIKITLKNSIGVNKFAGEEVIAKINNHGDVTDIRVKVPTKKGLRVAHTGDLLLKDDQNDGKFFVVPAAVTDLWTLV